MSSKTLVKVKISSPVGVIVELMCVSKFHVEAKALVSYGVSFNAKGLKASQTSRVPHPFWSMYLKGPETETVL